MDAHLWASVQELRKRYSRRHPGAIRRRQYALSGLLVCAACGRRLTGHVGRYRHVDACADFVGAARRPRRAFSRNLDRRVRGESYPAHHYDGLIAAALGHVAANASLAARTIPLVRSATPAETTETARRRIEAARDAALSRYRKDHDLKALEASLTRLDEEERMAPDGDAPTPIEPRRVKDYLARPATLWVDTQPPGRQALARALFDRIEALGPDLILYPSAEAQRYGWASAFGSTAIACSTGQYGRGERI